MKHIRLIKKRQILKIYLISYISIALLALSATGLTSNILFSRELQRTNEETVRDKLSVASASLNHQFHYMKEIAEDISINHRFTPGFFQMGISQEWEMMRYLKLFAGYLPFDFSYYLYYPQMNAVYSSAAKYTLNDFLHYVYPQLEGSMTAAMEETGVFQFTEGGVAIISFKDSLVREPFQLIVVLPVKTLLDYAAEVSGIDYGALTLQTQSAPVQESEFSGFQADAGYGVSLLMRADLEQPLGGWIGKILPLLITLAILLLIAAVLLARRNYAPVRRLMAQYGLNAQDNADEFELIDRRLAVEISKNNQSQETLQNMIRQLEAHRCELRRQLLLQLLYQGSVPTEDMLRSVQLFLPGHFNALLLVRQIQDDETEEISKNIEQLSVQDDMVFYAVVQENSQVMILINAAKRTDIFTGIDLLRDLFPTAGRLSMLGMCDSWDMLPSLSRRAVPDKARETASLPSFQSTDKMDEILAETESGNEQTAIACVYEMEMEMEIAALPPQIILGQRAELAARLYRLALQGDHMYVKEQIAGAILNTGSKSEYLDCMISTIRFLCHASSSAHQARASQRGAAILKYIQDHLSDMELSLESIADSFHVSTRIASGDIKEKTGMSYMDYVKTERTKLACQMLLETEMSVQEIAAAVGYINTSYFIRIFREYSGMTPSIYRSAAASLKENKMGDMASSVK